ncbi:FAD-dependent oxidoreductase [Mycoplasma iguanae]|uniref:FAD-dependent oxidoreductase n=1 Tax=Mycoplasma iguanae TaxID=292461 RepID=A0ABY5R860_9MOLU|nr:FAD-dependent oxidoreductase [Mycoplasma iguanae]UVD81698.1 FAD-dependent oxidoreductase [Mycoplasma iguanae]
MENKVYDVLIIGAGPAALTAAIYASRGDLTVAFIEKGAPGGKLVYQSKIENWPGDKMIEGHKLALKMFEHSKQFGAEYLYGDVVEIKSHSEFDKEVILANGESLKSKSIVIASGMKERVPETIKGIYEFEHRGVSYCAICDGPLYGKNPTGVIGGGNSAVEEAAFLASVASEVHVFVKDSAFIAEKRLVRELEEKSNVKIYFNSEVLELKGESGLESAIVNVNGERKEIKIKSLFPFIGQLPSTNFAKDLGILDPRGFIKVDNFMETSVKGIYAIGDVIVKDIRQISTAVADGSIVGKILTNRITK